MWIKVGYSILLSHAMMKKVQEIIVKVVIEVALITDELLVDSYYQAVRLNLDEEFIALLLAELQRRRLRQTIASCYAEHHIDMP